MTLQQLKYVVAVNNCRNYARAAAECSVTQPTLSAMLLKLENELDVRIFERTNKNVTPTLAGEKIIKLAEKTLAHVELIHNVTNEKRGSVSGKLKLSVGPTIAPYILPDFIINYKKQFPQVQLQVKDMKLSSVLNALVDGSIDAGIGISGSTRRDITEIPLYTEPMAIYASPRENKKERGFTWVMKEALSLREKSYGINRNDTEGQHIYEATNLEQLIRMVDTMGGSTVIPQMHMRYLSREQLHNVRPFPQQEMAHRSISLYIKSTHDKELLVNSLLTVLKQIIPSSMISPELK